MNILKTIALLFLSHVGYSQDIDTIKIQYFLKETGMDLHNGYIISDNIIILDGKLAFTEKGFLNRWKIPIDKPRKYIIIGY